MCGLRNGATDMERKFAADWKEDTGEKCLYMKVYSGNVKYQYLFSDGKGLWEKYGAF